MKDPKQYQQAKKILLGIRNSGKRGRPSIFQLQGIKPLEHYFLSSRKPVKSPSHLTRFRNLNLRYDFLDQLPLTLAEKVLYTDLPEFDGYFDDLFLFNPHLGVICTQLAHDLHHQGKSLPHPIYDYFILEMARIHTGNPTYRGFQRNLLFFNPTAFAHILEDPQFFPTPQDFSEFFHLLPLEMMYTVFYEILSEFIDLHLISFRIMIWDCQFIHTNGSDYKLPDSDHYSDRDAGIRRHQNKFLGLGYMASTLYIYCNQLVVPVYCMIFPANLSDKVIFHTTMEGYYKHGLPNPYLLLADAGAYAVKNLRFLATHNTIGMINAPKTVKHQHMVHLREDIHLNRDFVPSSWTDADLLSLYSLRTTIERQFSHNVQIYHVKEVNIRGIDQVAKHRFVVLLLDLLTQLTALKVGKPELLGRFTAFSMMRSGDSMERYWRALQKHGYRLFQISEGQVVYPLNTHISP